MDSHRFRRASRIENRLDDSCKWGRKLSFVEVRKQCRRFAKSFQVIRFSLVLRLSAASMFTHPFMVVEATTPLACFHIVSRAMGNENKLTGFNLCLIL